MMYENPLEVMCYVPQTPQTYFVNQESEVTLPL